MSHTFDSRLGEQLYQLLPELYRTRDKDSQRAGGDSRGADLARYLDTQGHLLDLIHSTVEQQLEDLFPDTSQDWLLPYFAQLLAATMLSPHPEGRQSEVANAVPWRQRKGTLKCVEEIAEKVGGAEAEIQEGWRRVAITPRIAMPLLDASVIDSAVDLDMSVPSRANRHPALPMATVDVRYSSRAVEAVPGNPAAKQSSFAGIRQTWRQVNTHGAPCFPDSFEDASRRTVDVRSESLSGSRYHHKRLLAYLPSPSGLFPMAPKQMQWSDRTAPLFEHLIEEREENGIWLISNRSNRVIEITDSVLLDPPLRYRIENLHFLGDLAVADGATLELSNVEAMHVEVPTFSTADAVLSASDCLFDTLSVGSGVTALDSCTVLGESHLYSLNAVDCLFGSLIGTEISGVVRHSRIPGDAPFSADGITIENCHSDAPVYFPGQASLSAGAVLAPGTPSSITAGARDGGEMGYFHRGRSNGPVRIIGDFTGASALALPAGEGFTLWDLDFHGAIEVSAGVVQFRGSAARSVIVTSAFATSDSGVVPVIDASDSLFDSLEVTRGLARLEYCTVMNRADCKYLQASDCLFAGTIAGVKKTDTESNQTGFINCIRFSALPAQMLEGVATKAESSPEKRLARALGLLDSSGAFLPATNTLEAPVFIKVHFCLTGGHVHRLPRYGEPGYAVLSPFTARSIRFGAEDGGEMGATHREYYSLKAEAVLKKMTEFLPAGIEPTLIFDTRLWRVPPEFAT